MIYKARVVSRLHYITKFYTGNSILHIMMKFTRNPVQCTLVGDGMVGKTAMASSFIGKRVEDGYVSTVFENYAGGTSINGESYTVSIYDPAGQHDYSRMRACTYTDCEVILMCYNANDRDTFDNISSFWLPEIRKFRGKKSPLILVATQTDTRNPNSDSSVSTQEGENLAREINTVGYMETTIQNDDTVKNVFKKVVMCALKCRKKKNRLFKRIFRQ